MNLTLLWLPDWLMKPEYVTLATWGLVLVTFLLDIAAIFQYLDGRSRSSDDRERWERAERQRAEREKQELLDRFIDKFNSPPMLVARAEMAAQLLGSPQPSISGVERTPNPPKSRLPYDIPPQTWMILDFFERMARRWKQHSFDIDSIDDAFSDYILILCGQFKTQMNDGQLFSRFAALKELDSALGKRHENASTTPGVDVLSAAWSKAMRRFWHGEYKLFRLLPGTLPGLGEEAEKGES
jgi:hypothetical protein